jgi:hypothetical protein
MAITADVRVQTGSTVVASPIGEVLRRFARAPRQRRGSPLGGAEAGATELLGSHDEPNRLRRRRSGRRHAGANSRTGLAPPVGRLCMSGVGAHQPRALAFQKWKSVVYGISRTAPAVVASRSAGAGARPLVVAIDSMNVVSMSRPPYGPAVVEARDSSSQGMAVGRW